MGQGRGKKLTKIQYYRESQGSAEGAEGLPQAGEAGLSLGGTHPVALMRINSCKSDCHFGGCEAWKKRVLEVKFLVM